MKKFIGLVLIQWLLFGGVFGQNTFEKIYYGINAHTTYLNAPSSNFHSGNDYFMGGQVFGDISGAEFGFITKFNYLDNVSWSKSLSSNFNSNVFTYSVTNDGGCVLVLQDDNDVSYIIKLDDNGDSLWVRSIDLPINCIEQTMDDGFVLAGENVAVRLDASGDTLWSKEFTGIDNFYCVQESMDGGIALADNIEWKLVKLDANGDTLWAKSYNISGSSSSVSSLLATSDSGYILVGRNSNSWGQSNPSSWPNSIILKVDSLGNVEWCNKYGRNIYGGVFLTSIDEIPNVGYAIAGKAINSGYDFQMSFAIKLNDSGNLQWSKLLADSVETGVDYPKVSISNNGINFLGGTANPISGDYIFLKKTNFDGNFCAKINPNFSILDSSLNVVATSLLVEGTNTSVYSKSSIFISDFNDFSLNSINHLSIDLCLISVDSTSTKNKVVWEKPITQAIDSFMVYREFGTGNYGVVGSVPYDSLTQFYDNTVGVNPNITSYRYKISAIDTCGNESQLSDFHETMHLSINLAPNGDINLIWDAYEGFPVTYYRILRDSTFSNNWEVLDSVSNNVFIWTDINPPTNGADYVIDVIAPFGCTSTKAQDHNSTRSNRSNILGGGVSPGANFTANFTQINTGGTIDFLDQSINNPTSWTWQFPGGSPAFSTQQNPSGIAYNTIGLYDVTLVISNAYGIDTLVKTNYIEVLSGGGGSAPACDFIASATQVPEGTPVDYLDLSLNGPTSWTWLLPGGSPAFSTVQDPVGINYNTAGTYDVTLITENVNGTDTLVKTAYIEVTSSIGVQEYKEGQVSIYPNPANDRLTVELTQIELPCFFALKDMQGRAVYSTVVNSEKLEIDLSAYAKGIYLIRVNNDNFSRELKLVKQ